MSAWVIVYWSHSPIIPARCETIFSSAEEASALGLKGRRKGEYVRMIVRGNS